MDEDEDDCISFGTPLPEYEDEATARKKAAKELQVRDEKGRQRFHGAFTGGFSAGYFNTVGTKEGWAPSSFVSSRTQTSSRFQQNPEDFMDDEDFGEFGIATRKIHTTSNFQDLSDGASRKRKFVDSESVIPGEAPLKDIVKPVRNSIGIKILQKLGWKPGQGIGPRVKKHGSGVKVYGCCPFPDSSVPEEDDPTMLAFTFAPEDTDEIFFQPKDNYFGIGYRGLSKDSVLSAPVDSSAPTSTKSWLPKDRKKLSISGQAFGVGAYEDDDEDIYTKDDMTQYDFSEFAPEKTESQKKSSKISKALDMLEGFHIAKNPASVRKHYPAPVLPPNFQPASRLLQRNYIIDQNKSRHALTAVERSYILGEKKFQSFQINSTQKIIPKKPESQEKGITVLSSSKNIPSFRPFPNDSDKQLRYEEYLKLKNSGEIEKFAQPSSMTEWEKQQEIEEFSRAAVLFKPLSATLSSRFESRSHLSVEHEVMSALEKIKAEKEEKAAPIKKSLLGCHNRETFDWYPASLLCRRFNVPNPYPNSSSTGVPGSQKERYLFSHLSNLNDLPQNADKESKDSSPSVLKNVPDEAAAINKAYDLEKISLDSDPKDDTQIKNSESERPPMDLFKDIFENSSDEDSPAEDMQTETARSDNLPKPSSQDTVVEDNVAINKVLIPESKKESTVSKKVGFGVFANLDLDALNERIRNSDATIKPDLKSDSKEIPDAVNKKIDSEDMIKQIDNDPVISKVAVDLYGPELPPNYSISEFPVSVPVVAKPKKHMKHKSKHKHKHHKHKSHKKKKKSSKVDSEKSSASEDEDIPPNLIIEKLKKLQRSII